MSIIEAEGLTKVYSASSGEVRALDGLDLAVEEGTVRASSARTARARPRA